MSCWLTHSNKMCCDEHIGAFDKFAKQKYVRPHSEEVGDDGIKAMKGDIARLMQRIEIQTYLLWYKRYTS